jgi:hypothetical protein
MAFGFAGAAAGANDALQELLARAFAQKQQQAAAERAQQQLMLQAEQERRIGEGQRADIEHRTQQTARQTRLDDVADAERRQVQNQRGVQRMIGDFLIQRGSQPLDAGARNQVTGMAVSEGIDVPRSLTEDPDREHRERLAEIAEQGRQARLTAASRPRTPSQQEQEWVIRDGVITPIPKGTARPGDQPASRTSSARSVTSGDAGRIAEFDTSLDDVDVLERDLGTTGTGSRIGASLPNVVTEITGLGSDSKQRQAVIDRVKQVIGKALEGGVLRKEDEAKYEKILPTIGDPPEVAAQKIAGLRAALIDRRLRFIESLGDAGFDVSKFPTERQKKAAPPKGGRKYYDANGKPVNR